MKLGRIMNGLSFMKAGDIRLNISIFPYLSGHEMTVLEIPFPVCVYRERLKSIHQVV